MSFSLFNIRDIVDRRHISLLRQRHILTRSILDNLSSFQFQFELQLQWHLLSRRTNEGNKEYDDSSGANVGYEGEEPKAGMTFSSEDEVTRHILCVLKLSGKTESVPPYYVLSHWRKDIKRRHMLIKFGFDHLTGNVELQQIDKACDAFYEVASMGISSDDYLLKVMNWINDLNNELTCKETSLGEIKASFMDQDSSRKASKVDQIVKKKLAGKRTQENSPKSKNCQSKKKGVHASTVQ